MDKEQEANSLRPATQQDMVKLRDRLEQYLPYSVVVYGALQVGLRYEGLLDSRKQTILYAEDSSLVVRASVHPEKNTQFLSFFWDEEKEDDKVIAQLLSTLPDFNWHEPFACFASSQCIMKVEQMVATGQLGFGDLIPRTAVNGLVVYSLTSSPKIVPRIPKGFEMRKVDAKDAQHLLDHWQNNFFETVDSYSRLLEVLPSFAIYRTPEDSAESELNSAESTKKYKTPSEKSTETQDNDNQSTITKPVAWTHLSTVNSISNTFTLPKYRRWGLSRAITHALATQLVQDYGSAFAFIADDNEASIKLHENLGFTKQCEIGWQYYKSSK